MLVGQMVQENGGRYMKGKSVHNARIERLWRDCRLFCFDFFMALFMEMESEDILNSGENTHLAALQYIFIPRINKALGNFTAGHNNQPSRSLHNKTPTQAFILSQFSYSPDVPDVLPPVENEHVPVTLHLLDLRNEQVIELLNELSEAIPNPFLNTPDHGIGMFTQALRIISDFINRL